MKIRTGFVSNSSSTSYVIAVNKTDKEKPCPTCGRKDPDFFELLLSSNGYSDDTKISARGYSDAVEYVKGYYFDDAQPEILEKLAKYKGKQWETACVSIAYHNEAIRTVLENLVASGRMVVIKGDND